MQILNRSLRGSNLLLWSSQGISMDRVAFGLNLENTTAMSLSLVYNFEDMESSSDPLLNARGALW